VIARAVIRYSLIGPTWHRLVTLSSHFIADYRKNPELMVLYWKPIVRKMSTILAENFQKKTLPKNLSLGQYSNIKTMVWFVWAETLQLFWKNSPFWSLNSTIFVTSSCTSCFFKHIISSIYCIKCCWTATPVSIWPQLIKCKVIIMTSQSLQNLVSSNQQHSDIWPCTWV
jgi:hypothetical protein